MNKKQNGKTIDFNVKLDRDDKAMLKQLSDDAGLTMSEICRSGIRMRFRQRFANEPTCAIGTACLCPNMHTLNAAGRPSDRDVLKTLEGANADLKGANQET